MDLDYIYNKYYLFHAFISDTLSKVIPNIDFYVENSVYCSTPKARHSCMNVIFFEIEEEIEFDEGKYICQFEDYFMWTLKLLIAEHETHKPAIDLNAKILSEKGPNS